MGKIFGILLMVVGIWVGLEIYQKGTQEALGGHLAFLGGSDDLGNIDRRTMPQRAGDAARKAHQLADERRSPLLGD